MSHLGNLARNGKLFPLTMLAWHKASKDTLKMIWSSVKENTNVPDALKLFVYQNENFVEGLRAPREGRL